MQRNDELFGKLQKISIIISWKLQSGKIKYDWLHSDTSKIMQKFNSHKQVHSVEKWRFESWEESDYRINSKKISRYFNRNYFKTLTLEVKWRSMEIDYGSKGFRW